MTLKELSWHLFGGTPREIRPDTEWPIIDFINDVWWVSPEDTITFLIVALLIVVLVTYRDIFIK